MPGKKLLILAIKMQNNESNKYKIPLRRESMRGIPSDGVTNILKKGQRCTFQGKIYRFLNIRVAC